MEMKKIKTRNWLWLLPVFALSACQSILKSNHTQALSACLDEKAINLLTEMVDHFESVLLNEYGSTDALAYQKFLNDIAHNTGSREMILNRDFRVMSDRFMSSSLFKDYKVKSSTLVSDEFFVELPPVEGETEEAYDPYVMNPESQYTRCLLSINKPTSLEQIVNLLYSGADVSPTLTAGALENSLSLEDYALPFVQLLITTQVYYEVGLVMLEVRPL